MGLLDRANMAFKKVLPYLKEDRDFFLLSAQLSYPVDDLPFANKSLDYYAAVRSFYNQSRESQSSNNLETRNDLEDDIFDEFEDLETLVTTVGKDK